jgi:hypothetical protein
LSKLKVSVQKLNNFYFTKDKKIMISNLLDIHHSVIMISLNLILPPSWKPDKNSYLISLANLYMLSSMNNYHPYSSGCFKYSTIGSRSKSKANITSQKTNALTSVQFNNKSAHFFLKIDVTLNISSIIPTFLSLTSLQDRSTINLIVNCFLIQWLMKMWVCVPRSCKTSQKSSRSSRISFDVVLSKLTNIKMIILNL